MLTLLLNSPRALAAVIVALLLVDPCGPQAHPSRLFAPDPCRTGLRATEQTGVVSRPYLSDPLEMNRADPKRMILYSDRDLRRREAQETLERLSKALASGQLTSPPRRHWLQ
jgi:hypothetical protein